MLDLSGWPAGMRVIVRKEKRHPGAQLRLTDSDGMRLTAFATNTPRGQLVSSNCATAGGPRCEDRIRTAKDCGLTNLPLHGFDQNRIWCAIIALACELIAWTQMLAFDTTPARRWEPNGYDYKSFRSLPDSLATRGGPDSNSPPPHPTCPCSSTGSPDSQHFPTPADPRPA